MTSRSERAGTLGRRIFGPKPVPSLPACQICAGPIDGEPNLALQDLGAELGRKFIPTCDSCFADPRLVELDRIPATPVRQPASDGSFEVTLSEARTVAYARSSASQRAASIVGIPAPDRAVLVVLEASAGLATDLFPAVPQTVPGNAERWHLVDVQALCAAYCRALNPPTKFVSPDPAGCALCRRTEAPAAITWFDHGSGVLCSPCLAATRESEALNGLVHLEIRTWATPNWTPLDVALDVFLGGAVKTYPGFAQDWRLGSPHVRKSSPAPFGWVDVPRLISEVRALEQLEAAKNARPDVTVSAA